MKNYSCVMLQAALLAGAAWVILPAAPVHAQTHSFEQVVIRDSTPRAVTTADNETVEVALADGTSIIVSPDSSVTVDTAADGTVRINVSAGLVRVAGGSSNQTRPISIVTPQSGMELRAGAAMIEVAAGVTRAHLLVGEGLMVTSGGVTRLIYRPGFEVATDGGTPAQPRRMTRQEVVDDVLRLSVGLSEETLPRVLSYRDGTLGETWEDFSQAIVVGAVPDTGENSASDKHRSEVEFAQAVTPPVVDPPVTDFSFDLAGALGAYGGAGGSVGATAKTVAQQSSSTVDESVTNYNQQFDEFKRENNYSFESGSQIYAGPTTNTLFGANNLTVGLAGEFNIGDDAPFTSLMGEDGEGVVYYQGSTSSGIQSKSPDLFRDDTGIIRFTNLPQGVFERYSFHADTIDDSPYWSAFTTFSALTYADSVRQVASPSAGGWHEGKGVAVHGLNYNTNFQRYNFEDLNPALVREDNFIFLDMDVMAALNWHDNSTGSFDPQELSAFLAQYGVASAAASTASEVDPTSSGTTSGAAFLIDDPLEDRRYIFATGGLDEVIAHPKPGHVIDYFHLSAGMEGDILNGIDTLTPGMFTDNGSRAFQRAETWTSLAGPNFSLAVDGNWQQTPFMIVNPNGPVIDTSIMPGTQITSPSSMQPKILYADIGFAEDANGRQVSSISAAIGEVEFRFTSELNGGSALLGNQQIVDAILRFRSVGSSRGVDETGATLSSLLVTSDFESTAAGGGNPNLGSGGTMPVADPGRLGFFVVENAGQVFDDVAADQLAFPRPLTLPGGTEQAVGSSNQTRFAALRLGVATGSVAVPANRWQGGGAQLGYASAILERESGGAVTLAALGAVGGDTTFLTPNLSFDGFDDAANTFRATIGGLSLGGAGGLSAYVDDDAYGARTDPSSGADLALIAGPMVADAIVDTRSANAGQKRISQTTANYEHVKWGFFFGDTKTAPGQREHAHLGSFAAGRNLTQSELAQMDDLKRMGGRAEATYRGHLVGNVLDAGGVRARIASGQFNDTFNFGSRTGTLDVKFDGHSMAGTSSAADLNAYRGQVAGSGLQGRLNGRFVGPLIRRSGVKHRTPAGVVGAFSMTDGAANGYRAVGTFAGE